MSPINPGPRYPNPTPIQQLRTVAANNQFIFGFIFGQVCLTVVWIVFRIVLL